MEHVEASVRVPVEADRLWRDVGSFQGVGRWHPWLASVKGEGESPGAVRVASTEDGRSQVERLLSVDAQEHAYRYGIESTPMPVRDYVGEFRVRGDGPNASTVEWSTTFEVTAESADPEAMVGDFLRAGLDAIERTYQ